MTTSKTKTARPKQTVDSVRAYYSGLVAKAQTERADGLEAAVHALGCQLDDLREATPDGLTREHRDLIRAQTLAMLSADTRRAAAVAGLMVFSVTGAPYIVASVDSAVASAVRVIRRAGKGIGRAFDDPGVRSAFITSFLSAFAATSGIDISDMMGTPSPASTPPKSPAAKPSEAPPASPVAEPGTAKPVSPVATPGTAKLATGVTAKKRAPKSK